MITESSLATAQIAQLFGSELLKVQKNATTDSGMQPEIVKINPKQFLVGQSQMTSQRKAEEQRMIQQLQAEAEAAYPTHSEEQPLPQQQEANPQPVQQTVANYVQQTPQQQRITPSAPQDVWEKINSNLERIANCLEKVDFTVKKKRIKRIKHEISSQQK